MASVINGTNIVLYYYDNDLAEGVPFGASTNCSFESSTDQVEVTSQSSAWFKEFKNDVITWSVKCDGFIALTATYNYAFLAQLQLDRTPITIKFAIDNDNGGATVLGYTIFTGLANLTSLTINGPVEGVSTYSVSLQGTGSYSITGIQVEPGLVIIGGSSVQMYDYTAAGGETTITWPTTIGLSCVSVSRGGIEVRSISTTGTPTGENVRFNSATGVLTFATARALESDEFIRAIFK